VPLALLELLPALQVISTCGVGYDGIPVAYAKARGIAVTHTPGVLDDAVCELGVGLLLGLLRDIPASDRFVRDGRWSDSAYPLTTSLAGKAVGIVGLGRIGRGIAARLQPFGVALAYSGSRKIDVPYRHVQSVLALADECNILIVCCKGGSETRHLVNAETLQALGPAGYLVNIARGSVVDTAALADALRAGRIKGAGLDVYESEPEPPAELLGFDSVVLTPHTAGSSPEAHQATLDRFIENATRHFAGQPVVSPI
jgi:lactate dehydrogenase-like 2-hydroxyacid dehydrogenase